VRRALVALSWLWLAFAAFSGTPRAASADSTRDGVLVVGLTGKYPPFSYFDERGELAGFDVDFAKALCAEMRLRCELVATEWDSLVASLLTDKIDAVVGSMAITEERSRAVRFSVPYYESGARLFVRPGAREPSTPGFAVGVTLGTTFERIARERFPSAEVRIYKGDTDVLQDLVTGRLDGMITDELVGAYMAHERGAMVEPLGARLLEERMGIPVKPGRDELIAAIDHAVGALRSSGVQRALLEKHLHVGGGSAASAERTSLWRSAAPLLLRGLGATVLICVAGIGLGIALSLVLAWGALSRGVIAKPTALLIDFVRSTPFMIQLFALYFGPPSLGLSVSAEAAGITAIAVHSAAYLAEVVKTSYRAVPDGQRLAARALGLSPWQSLRHVVGPQMLPIATVPCLNTVVAMIKDSAVVSVIGIYELTLQTQRIISASFRPIELYAVAAAMYFLLTFPLLVAGRRLERRWRDRGLLHG
jgi:His/Glu/Gln/Arg/opine family amino acid ABC transporter permease subunit